MAKFLLFVTAALLAAAPGAATFEGESGLSQAYKLAANSGPYPKAKPIKKRALTAAEKDAAAAIILRLVPRDRYKSEPLPRYMESSVLDGRMPDGSPCFVRVLVEPKYEGDQDPGETTYSLVMFNDESRPRLDKLRGGLSIDPARKDPDYQWFNERYFSASVRPDRIEVLEQDGSEFMFVKETQARAASFYESGRLKSFEDKRYLGALPSPSPYGGRCDFPETARVY